MLSRPLLLWEEDVLDGDIHLDYSRADHVLYALGCGVVHSPRYLRHGPAVGHRDRYVDGRLPLADLGGDAPRAPAAADCLAEKLAYGGGIVAGCAGATAGVPLCRPSGGRLFGGRLPFCASYAGEQQDQGRCGAECPDPSEGREGAVAEGEGAEG